MAVFAEVSSASRRDLRDTLGPQGVYVKKGRQISIADSLHDVVQEEVPSPENDEKPQTQGPITSVVKIGAQSSVKSK